MENKSTFITEARREQIMDAAVQTLDEIGFVKASLAQIAKRAAVSTALISYHFSNKQDLMNAVLEKLLEESSTAILESVYLDDRADVQLELFIRESLNYQYKFPAKNIALIEIIFNAKTEDGIPFYRLNEDEPDPVAVALDHILKLGQNQGIFKGSNFTAMINMIQGAIGESMFQYGGDTAEKEYVDDLIEMIKDAVMKK